MTPEEIQKHTDEINAMSHYDMASLSRYAPSGHPYFDSTLPLWSIFNARFKELGGWNPQLSKDIGWN